MRPKLVAGVATLFALAAIAVSLVLIQPAFLTGASGNSGNDSLSYPVVGNTIVRENALPGTNSWQIPPGHEATTEIQAYAGATSVLPGKDISFYVSTHLEGTHYWIDIYRVGWYGGSGGRLITSIGDQVGHAQGYYDQITHRLIGCNSCKVNKNIGLVEANWQQSYKLIVSSNWTTGIYLAKFTDANGKQTYTPFDVLGNNNSAYVAVTPDSTYAAYNNWGGYSLYESENSVGPPGENEAITKGVKVSFDRPYAQVDGSSQVLIYEANAVHWMERFGYDVSYISNVDLHIDPLQLLHHKAYISLGHDEYWTRDMRDGVLYARNRGVGLAFLGADAIYWQMRFEQDSLGNPNRTVVCYKVQTVNHDLARDPLYGNDNAHLTTQWRDPAINLPENSLIGIMFDDLTHKVRGFPWRVDAGTKSSLLNGTGLEPGQEYGCGLVGYEWDRIFANGYTPAGLQVLGTTNTISDTGADTFSNTTYYIAQSGAMIFATGSIYWTTALDSYRVLPDNNCVNKDPVVSSMQTLMARVMDNLIIHHSTQS